jgi:protocatechuate 3,4-dioxygenase beta subunit
MKMTALLLALVFSTQAVEARGAISGRVLIRGENAPVQDARVVALRIRRAPLPNGVVPQPSPQTLTGPDGSYTFEGLEPGEYGINVQKAGFAVGLGTPARTTVVVVAGQTVKAADTFLDRGGAIAGRILDTNGEPLPDIRVSALTPAPLSPGAAARGSNVPLRLIPAGQPGRTDDLGEFRVFGLEPGEYVVVASEQRSVFQNGSPSATTLATTYFPGVTAEGSAQRIAVTAGQTTSGIEIRMATTNGFLVSGIVVTADGKPVEGATLFLTTPTLAGIGPHVSRAEANGRFQIANVPAGTYRLSVASSSSGPMAKFKPPAPISVTVTDSNVEGLRLVVVTGGDRNP